MPVSKVQKFGRPDHDGAKVGAAVVGEIVGTPEGSGEIVGYGVLAGETVGAGVVQNEDVEQSVEQSSP